MNKRKTALISRDGKEIEADYEEWIPPIPGSEVPDLESLPGDPAAIPELGAINALEENITLELNNLKTFYHCNFNFFRHIFEILSKLIASIYIVFM